MTTRPIGDLIYTKWYSFNAEIILSKGSKYQLVTSGFWDATIELRDNSTTLLEFSMGWKGIVIKTFFDNKEETFLLTLKGLLSSKFILMDTNKTELLIAEADFKWNKPNYDYTIETSQTFDNFKNKNLLLLTTLHCINYFLTMSSSSG